MGSFGVSDFFILHAAVSKPRHSAAYHICRKDGESFERHLRGFFLYPPNIQKGMCFIMAKKTMEAIRQAELDAEQRVKAAQAQANAKIADANAQAEKMIADARLASAKKLADTRSATLQDNEQTARAAADDVTREIETLRRKGQKNEQKAISSVIAEMN